MIARNPVYPRIDGAREPLSQQVAEQIINLITSEHLQPGDMLPSQQELSESFGVSRTVIREALQSLNGMGVLRISQGIRAQVIKADPASLAAIIKISAGAGSKGLQNLLIVRDILEPEVAALAAKNATPEDIKHLEDAIMEMDRQYNDIEQYIVADAAFHHALGKATGSDLLERITNPVVSLLQEMRQLACQSEGAPKRAQEHHRAILDAIKAHNPDGARAAMCAHLVQVRGELGVSEATAAREDEATSN